MNSEEIVRVLKGVPEFHLRLVDLVREIVEEDGSLNLQKAAFYQKEIEEAIGEAAEYIKATKEAVQCLREMAR